MKVVLDKLNLDYKKEPELIELERVFIQTSKTLNKEVTIGLIGKYIELKDSYKSIAESIIHAGTKNECKVELEWIHSEKFNDENVSKN
jgi:CTP synthase